MLDQLRIGAAALLLGLGQPGAAGSNPAPVLRAPLVDSLTLHFAVPPDTLWSELKSMYVEGTKFASQGFTVEKITDDPLAYLGGTRIRKTLQSGEVDERVARFTRIDDDSRFLALSVRYASGLSGKVSYEVRPSGSGSDFQLIVHVDQDFTFAPGTAPTADGLARKVREVVDFHHKELVEFWSAEKARLEAKTR